MENTGRPPNSVPLKVMIDRKNQRVAFAEANATFTDTLVSFLTIPLGTIVKILYSHGDVPAIGATKNLYESVARLPPNMFFSNACKTMLLHPRNAAGGAYRELKVKVDYSDWENPETNYFCPERCDFGLYEGMLCSCGRQMTEEVVDRGIQTPLGAFVNEMIVPLITDDMRLMPLSTTTIMSLLHNQGLSGQSNMLEEKDINVEVFQLLVNMLFSRSPLTDIVFPKKLQHLNFPINVTYSKTPKEEPGVPVRKKEKEIPVKLFLRKTNKKLLYAEVGSDFVDLIFSFLAIPAGAIVNLFGGDSPLKSMNSLSRSIANSCIGNLLEPSGTKEMLVNPKLAPFYKCNNQLLNSDQEMNPGNMQNPKCGSILDRGSCMNELAMFIVTDDLVVKPLSSTCILSFLDGLKVPVNDLEERIVITGKYEALNLLKASLMSTTVLTDVFCHSFGSSKPHP